MSTLPPYFIVTCSQTHLPNHILSTSPKHLFDFFIGQQLYHHRTRNVIIVIFVFIDIQQKYQNPVTHAHNRVYRVFRCPIITYYSIFHHVTTDAPPPRVPSFRGVRRSRWVCIQKHIPKVLISGIHIRAGSASGIHTPPLSWHPFQMRTLPPCPLYTKGIKKRDIASSCLQCLHDIVLTKCIYTDISR